MLGRGRGDRLVGVAGMVFGIGGKKEIRGGVVDFWFDPGVGLINVGCFYYFWEWAGYGIGLRLDGIGLGRSYKRVRLVW